MQELQVYSMIGTEGFSRLVAAFYRQVPQDDLLGPMYPAADLPGAEQRLRDFLIGRFEIPRRDVQLYDQSGGPGSPLAQRDNARLPRHELTCFNYFAGTLR
jgi:truncated hemoglobin YjbI